MYAVCVLYGETKGKEPKSNAEVCGGEKTGSELAAYLTLYMGTLGPGVSRPADQSAQEPASANKEQSSNKEHKAEGPSQLRDHIITQCCHLVT